MKHIVILAALLLAAPLVCLSSEQAQQALGDRQGDGH